MTGSQLAERLTASALARAFQGAEAKLRSGLALVAEAQSELDAAFLIERPGWVDSVGSTEFELMAGHKRCDVKPDEHLERWRRKAWGFMVERLELRRMMSISAWEKLQDQIEKGECPPIDELTINAMLEQFSAGLESMLEEAVKEVFDWLRPRYTKYKTNSQFEVGERVKLSRILKEHMELFGPGVDYHYEQHLIALENVLSALDGRGAIAKSYQSELTRAIEACKGKGWPLVGETRYFSFRGYMNRSLHLTFKRLDLLARFNQIAGGARLRPKERSTE